MNFFHTNPLTLHGKSTLDIESIIFLSSCRALDLYFKILQLKLLNGVNIQSCHSQKNVDIFTFT